jgi:Integral membrane protein
MMKEKIIPYQSSSKSVFIILGIILMIWGVLFSIFLISQSAWPVSLFLGAEYLFIVFLIWLYFK